MRAAYILLVAAACGEGSPVQPDAAATCAQLDCAGVCNGSATMDRCGACDSDPANDCWKGKHGTALLKDFPQQTDLGSGRLTWSENDAAAHRGYLYAGPDPSSPLGFGVAIANVTPMNACDPINFPDQRGYMGLSSVHELVDAASLPYSTGELAVLLGAEASTCNTGLLVYSQNGRYGVLRFISLDAEGNANVEFWLGDVGVTDFRNAP